MLMVAAVLEVALDLPLLLSHLASPNLLGGHDSAGGEGSTLTKEREREREREGEREREKERERE